MAKKTGRSWTRLEAEGKERGGNMLIPDLGCVPETVKRSFQNADRISGRPRLNGQHDAHISTHVSVEESTCDVKKKQATFTRNTSNFTKQKIDGG